jgi:hypothetical protein
MENTDIFELWKNQTNRIEQSLSVNRQLLKEVINQKVRFTLQPLIALKSWGIVAFVFYILVLIKILFWAFAVNSSGFGYFTLSISAILLINIKGLIDYIRHLILTKSINYDGSITEIQEKLIRLQLSIIKHSRTMWLQLPFFTTFYLSSEWFPQSASWILIVIQLLVTGLSVYGSVWLFKNQTVENIHKKWLKTLIAGSGGKYVINALEFYYELEEYKTENTAAPDKTARL